MSVESIDSGDIRQLHQLALDRYGGVQGENEPGMIEYMAEKPFMFSFGQELYPGLFLKSAVYLEGFATHQYFSDGNKRTAYLTAAVFLELT
ncbi:type II toxin-antitoxin system death-on-curing family toxin [Salibacterium sp. K-3]